MWNEKSEEREGGSVNIQGGSVNIQGGSVNIQGGRLNMKYASVVNKFILVQLCIKKQLSLF